MATFRGRDGVVEVGSTAVLRLQNFTTTLTEGQLETDSMGDEWMTRKGDLKDASGEIVFFEDDATSGNGQTSLTIGAEVTLRQYTQGNASGRTYLTGPARISEISAPVAKGEVVTRTASWVGNGAWSTATVGA
jgi:hypothetical protein